MIFEFFKDVALDSGVFSRYFVLDVSNEVQIAPHVVIQFNVLLEPSIVVLFSVKLSPGKKRLSVVAENHFDSC